jgi:hypothetical protein
MTLRGKEYGVLRFGAMPESAGMTVCSLARGGICLFGIDAPASGLALRGLWPAAIPRAKRNAFGMD